VKVVVEVGCVKAAVEACCAKAAVEAGWMKEAIEAGCEKATVEPTWMGKKAKVDGWVNAVGGWLVEGSHRSCLDECCCGGWLCESNSGGCLQWRQQWRAIVRFHTDVDRSFLGKVRKLAVRKGWAQTDTGGDRSQGNKAAVQAGCEKAAVEAECVCDLCTVLKMHERDQPTNSCQARMARRQEGVSTGSTRRCLHRLDKVYIPDAALLVHHRCHRQWS
jgi:hypothetical protein